MLAVRASDVHRLAVANVLVCERTGARQRHSIGQDLAGQAARRAGGHRAVVDLARRRDGAGDRLRRNGGDRRAVGADRVVAGVSARQRTADIHQLADGSILVREGARRRQRNGVALDHAVERARRIGGSGAVIGLAGGRDGARQGLGRDVGQRRGVGAQQVVARIGTGPWH
ncbi:hypothetical protein G6F35_015596 [Rhizopus arrhizus]|nr:hypothetical protein G6F35_015596 [Rhizopus arrhizus]